MEDSNILEQNPCYTPLSIGNLAERDKFLRSLTESVASGNESSDGTSELQASRRTRSLRALKRQNLDSARRLRKALDHAKYVRETREERYNAKNLEKSLKTKKYIDDQLKLMQRHISSGKMSDVARFSENLLEFLSKRLRPNDKAAYVVLAASYGIRANIKLGHMEKTWKLLTQAKENASGLENFRSEIFILEGEVYAARQQFSEAAQCWENALTDLEGDRRCWVHSELGQCYWEMGLFGKAEENAKSAVKIGGHPWTVYSLLLLGQIDVVNGDILGASEKFADARSLCDNMVDCDAVLEYIESSIDLFGVVLGTESGQEILSNNGIL